MKYIINVSNQRRNKMKIHLYNVFDLQEINETGESPMDNLRTMTEQELRAEFDWALNHGKIPHELIDDYGGDPDYCDELDDNPELKDLKIGTIIDMLNDIGNYECGTGYYILETDIEI